MFLFVVQHNTSLLFCGYAFRMISSDGAHECHSSSHSAASGDDVRPRVERDGTPDDLDSVVRFAINLDEVSSQLLIPVDTISEQLLVQRHRSSSPTRDDASSNVGSGEKHLYRSFAPRSPSQRPHRASVSSLTHVVTTESSETLGKASLERRESSIVILHGVEHDDEASIPADVSVALVTRRRDSGLTTVRIRSASVSEGHSQRRESTVAAPADTDALLPSSKKTKKRVHFPDNVVKSVCIVPAVDGSANHELQVEYNRPWYAYVLFMASNVFFVLAWTEIMKAAWPSTDRNESLPAAVAVVTFISVAFATVFFLAYVLLTWRPVEYELVVIRSKWFLRDCSKLIVCGVLAMMLLMCSCMSHITCVNSIAFTTTPLIVICLHEKLRHSDAVTGMDSCGTMSCVVGLVVLCVGEERAHRGVRLERIGAIVASIAGGVLMAPFLSLLRRAGKDVSNAAIITATLLCASAASAAIAAGVKGFTSPLGNGRSGRESTFTDLSNEELLRVMLSGAFMFFFWFLHHTVSLYFDRMSIVAGYTFCTPMVLVIYHLQGLPTIDRIFEAIGGGLVTFGCSAVVFSGWLYRKNISIPIEY